MRLNKGWRAPRYWVSMTNCDERWGLRCGSRYMLVRLIFPSCSQRLLGSEKEEVITAKRILFEEIEIREKR